MSWNMPSADEVRTVGDGPLYAVIGDEDVVWRVVGFDVGSPRVVPVARFGWDATLGAVQYPPPAVMGGWPVGVGGRQAVIYVADFSSAAQVITDRIEEAQRATRQA